MLLIFLPVILLVVTAFVILALGRIRTRFGYAWLIAATICLISWGILLALRFFSFQPVSVLAWVPVSRSVQVLFQLDSIAWTYAFALMSLLLAVIVSSVARYKTAPSAWTLAGNMLVTAAGLTAVMAGTPMTLAVCWGVFDLVELVVVLGTVTESQTGKQVAFAFSVRVTGTFILLWAMNLSQEAGQVLNFSRILPDVGIYLLLATALRLGVIPLHLPYTQTPMRRGVGTILRMAGLASSFMLLGRLPVFVVPASWAIIVLVFAALAAVYGGWMWLISGDEILGRPYLLVAISGVVVASVIRGQPQAGLAWGAAVIFSGGLLFLFSAWDKRIVFIPVLSLIGLTGLPFTPAAQGWNGLVVLPFSPLDVVLIAAHVLICLGYLRKIFTMREPMRDLENWTKVFYVMGLMLLVVGQWIALIIGGEEPGWGIWWASGISLLLTLGLFFLERYSRRWIEHYQGPVLGWITLVRRASGALNSFFQLSWLYSGMGFIYRVTQEVVQILTKLFEGDSGILWVLVLLAVMISLFGNR